MRLLLACIDGLAWPLMDPPPFMAGCLEQGAVGPLSEFSYPDPAWVIDDEPLWTGLTQGGLSLGAMNLPGLWPSQAVKGFMVCRIPGGQVQSGWTHPPELADDLGDYVQPKRQPSDAPNWRSPLKDTAFAEAAALARLRYEHFRRLCAQYQPEVAALGWSGLAAARQLFGLEAGRADLMLAQLDDYLARLMDEFQPSTFVLVGFGMAGEPGVIMILGQDRVEPGRLRRTAWTDLLPALLDLAGLPSPKPASMLADLTHHGDITS